MKKNAVFFLLACVLSSSGIRAQILTESFDGTTFPPSGWTNTKTGGSASPGTWLRLTSGTNPTAAPQSGAGMAYYNCYSWSSGNKAELATPALNFTAGSYAVSFWMYRDAGQPAKYDSVSVYVNTINASSGGFRLGLINRARSLTPTETTDGWYQYTFNIPASFNTATNYIIFKATSDFGNRIYLDDVSVFSQSQTTDPTSVTASSVSVCSGQSTTLYANGIDGTVYWYSGSCGGTPLGTGDSITLSPAQTTTYFARNFKNNQFSAGCASLSVQFNQAYNVSANATICAHESVTLPGGQIADTSGTYTVSVPTASGCDSVVTLNLTVLPEITASAGISICPGDSALYNGVYYDAAGSYSDTLTASNGCDSMFTLLVSNYNTSTPTITQNGFSLSTQTYASYQWIKNGNDITGANGPGYSVSEDGSYAVRVEDVNGCILLSQPVNVLGTGLSQNKRTGVFFFPNPASERLYINGGENTAWGMIIIRDLQGREMIHEPFKNNFIDTDKLSPGTYIVTLYDGARQQHGLFQKQ